MTDPHVVRPGTLPTPFSAEEIRAATVDGVSLVIKSTPRDGEPMLRRTTFVACDDEGALRSFVPIDASGTELGEVETAYATWAELQGHAVFDAASATRVEETRPTPLGIVECVRYDVRDEDGVSVFWFDRNRPGMPVVYELRGTDGAVHVLVEVVEMTTPA